MRALLTLLHLSQRGGMDINSTAAVSQPTMYVYAFGRIRPGALNGYP